MDSMIKPARETSILLVDDEADFRNALAFSFKRKGYQVLLASNGREALELIQSNDIDIVVSDIRMPGGDGVELLDRAKERHFEAPVILLVTGFAELSAEEAHHKGAEAMFSKPLDRKALEETIQRLLTPVDERWARISEERIDVNLKIQIQSQGLSEAIDAKVVSLGRGGMFVTFNQDYYPNVNDAVTFKIGFNDSMLSLDGNGIVRWIRVKDTPQFPAGCGIEFTHLPDEGRKQVLAFINSKKPRAYIPKR